MENTDDLRTKTLRRVRLLMSAYADYYLEELENKDAEDAAVREMEREKDENPSSPIRFMVLTAENNARVMLDCMKDCRRLVKLLNDENEDFDDWMLVGMNAIFDHLNKSHEIPFDLAASMLGLVLAQYRPGYKETREA